jgi:hypothetical protein
MSSCEQKKETLEAIGDKLSTLRRGRGACHASAFSNLPFCGLQTSKDSNDVPASTVYKGFYLMRYLIVEIDIHPFSSITFN